MELHLAHETRGEDFSEKLKAEAKEALASNSKRPPWKRPSSKALDHSIAKAVSKDRPKNLDTILREVQDDYGLDSTEGALYRNVQRHLAKLVQRGHILRIDLGKRLYAYLRPGSRLVRDVANIRQQLIAETESWLDIPVHNNESYFKRSHKLVLE